MTPVVVLTSGDPSGIGPELAAKAWAMGERFVWLGDPRHLPAGTDWVEVAEGAAPADGPLPVLSLRRFELTLLGFLGMAPALDRCAGCGSEWLDGPAQRFDAARGGVCLLYTSPSPRD